MEKVNYGGHKIVFVPDTELPNPRENDGKICEMICFHKKYEIGDSHDLKSEDYSGWDGLRQHLIKERGAKVITPIYMYDHSSQTIKTSPFSCKWDSGQIGFAIVTALTIKECYGDDQDVTPEFLVGCGKQLELEVQDYCAYIEGDGIGYKIYAEADEAEETVIQEVFGFYGSDEKTNGALESAKADIRHILGFKEHTFKDGFKWVLVPIKTAIDIFLSSTRILGEEIAIYGLNLSEETECLIEEIGDFEEFEAFGMEVKDGQKQ